MVASHTSSFLSSFSKFTIIWCRAVSSMALVIHPFLTAVVLWTNSSQSPVDKL